MIVDAHTHIGFSGAIIADPASLAASMKKAGIDKALVFAGRINGCSTQDLLGALKPYRGILYPVGSLTAGAGKRPSKAQVEEWLASGAVHGLKFYPGYEYFYPQDDWLAPILELLAKYRRPAIFHSGDTYSRVHVAKLKYAHPIHLDEVAVEHPQLRVVMAHLGYPWIVDAAEVVYKNKNVFADCSGFVYGAFTAKNRAHFRECWREFVRISAAPERVLFGSDWPISDQSSYVRTMKDIAGPRATDFFSKNAVELFGLEA
ncbi:MAG TPA: amidohydrolase family protein [Candidatus Binatia bacterium]|jgi:predicted TIM-barrel fold metal-dependent hydrolase|nr:amidohydrolase family protein [Candidatus Binatia bacterium]